MNDENKEQVEKEENLSEEVSKDTENLSGEMNDVPQGSPAKTSNKPWLILVGILIVLFGGYFLFSALTSDEEVTEEEKEEEVAEDVPFDMTPLQTSYAVDEHGRPLFPTDKYALENMEFFVTTSLENITTEIDLEAHWYYDDVLLGQASLRVDEEESDIWFSLSQPAEGWELGEYEVIIIYDEEEVAKTNFDVVSDDELTVKSFFHSGIGIYFEYETDWEYEYLNEWSLVFSGAEGTDEYYTTVNLQNILTLAGGGVYEDLDAFYEEYKSQIEGADGTVTDYTEGQLESMDFEYNYLTFSTTYEQEGEEQRQEVYLIERDGEIFHQVTYSAPTALFDDAYDKFMNIFDSIEIVR